ncbi:unnamed protein product [Auanema sp. JU1783]|nr:unnamed protein product [Auanema sp. JU1783]
MSCDIIGPPTHSAGRVLSNMERPGLIEKLVVPGHQVTTSVGFMRGHGTYMKGEDIIASLAGTVQQVNRLVSVKSIKSRYGGEVGDVVIGRVRDVQQKRWKLDTNSRLDSNLPLSSVNLPGGELRRKSVEDELMMREYLKEGDIVSAEVQQVNSDGVINLHTRNLKYGKLAQGVLVKIPSYLVKRRKTHFHSLPCGAGVIIGCNGFVWISPELSEDPDGGYNQDLEVLTKPTRKVMARLAECIRVLAEACIYVYDTTIMQAYETSLRFSVLSLARPEVAAEIAEEVVTKIQSEMEI